MALKPVKTAVIYVLLIFYALCNVYPLLWMAINSFKSEREIALRPFAPPSALLWDNYAKAWETGNLGRYFTNSIAVSLAALALTVLLGALTSFFLSWFRFRGRQWLYSYFIFGMLVPIHATLVPLFILEQKIGILNTRLSLVPPYIAFHLPITIFILVSFMNAFHKDIEESAIIDGCGIFQLFWSVILPMTRPALATVVILNFINNWNEFSFALVLINDMNLKTLPLALASLAGEHTTNVGVQTAGLVMALVPTLILYLLMEKQLVKGMTAGAVKG